MQPSPRKRSRNPTINDVADLARVSYQTVSRVLNGMPHVSAGARGRVEAAVKKLGFRPNMTARQLASQRSTTVGLVTFATSFHGPAQILATSEQAAKELGLSLMFSGIVEQSTQEIARAVNELCAHQVCGILIHMPVEMNLCGLQDVCRNMPVVAVDSDFGFKCPSVFINQEHASRKATRHLIDRGHKKIAYLRGPVLWRAATLRYAGWLKELRAADLEPGPVVSGDWTAASGFEAAKEVIAKNWGKCTAIVAANDQMALGAIRAFEESGIRVPQTISIVGFDDIPEAGFFRPPLSTMKQDFVALGRLSMQCLMAQLSPGQVHPRIRIIEPPFIERESTAFRTPKRISRAAPKTARGRF